jgi:hypothetical protein
MGPHVRAHRLGSGQRLDAGANAVTLLNPSPRTLTIVMTAALFIALRLVHLDADPPTSLPNGETETSELVVEGPAKAHEARNEALFGNWRGRPANEYQFWRIQSPVWVYPLSWTFRVFGVGYPQLRVFSILTSVLGLLGALLIASRRLSGVPLASVGLLLSVNYYYIAYSRAGLLEPLLNGFLALTVWFLLLAFTNPLWLIAAQLAFIAAFLTKQTALVLFPVFIIGSVWGVLRSRREERPSRSWTVPLATLATLGALVGGYVATGAYWSTLVSNLGHALFDDVWVSRIDASRFSITDVFARAFQWERWRDGLLWLMPVSAPLIAIELGRIVHRLVTRREVDEWDGLISAWFLCVLAMLQITPLTSLRYYIIAIVPGALLAGGGLQTIFDWTRASPRRWFRALVVAALCAGLVATHARWWIDWAQHPSYAIVETNRDIAKRIGDRDAAIIGAWAAPLAFETPFETYYVKHRYNTSRETLLALDVTHLLIRHRGDPFDWFSRHDWTFWTLRHLFPDAAAGGEPMARYPLWDGSFVDLRAATLPSE